jgi:hypothetical protein
MYNITAASDNSNHNASTTITADSENVIDYKQLISEKADTDFA